MTKLSNEEVIQKMREVHVEEPLMELIQDATDRMELMSKFLRHNLLATKLEGVFFICGEAGERDQNGIPERIHICPAYGSDVSYVFTRGKSYAPEW